MRNALLLAVFVCSLNPGALRAAGFDGTTPLLCATTEVAACSEETACRTVGRNSGGIPRFMRIDIEAGEMRDPQLAPDASASSLSDSNVIDGKLLLQGIDPGVEQIRDGIGWTMTIDQETGDFVLMAASRSIGYVLFGACVAEDLGREN